MKKQQKDLLLSAPGSLRISIKYDITRGSSCIISRSRHPAVLRESRVQHVRISVQKTKKKKSKIKIVKIILMFCEMYLCVASYCIAS